MQESSSKTAHQRYRKGAICRVGTCVIGKSTTVFYGAQSDNLSSYPLYLQWPDCLKMLWAVSLIWLVYKETVTTVCTHKVLNMAKNSKYVCCGKLILLIFLMYT